MLPIGTALRSLGIYDGARPRGKHKYTVYEHTLPCMRNRKEMKVCSFAYDGTLAVD
jgi:hypothetical protein